MKTPVIVVNFKGYQQVCGSSGITLAKTCETVANETGVSIVIAPQMTDLALIVNSVNIPVFSQTIDDVAVGSCTGSVTPESVAGAKAKGTLLNHSEHRIRLADIESLITRARNLNLETILCTNNIAVTKASAALSPDYVAIEPPELIGGDISVTTADPGIVSNAVKVVNEINPNVGVLCGAGVKTREDVKEAIELGTKGVLLASGVIKAADPKSVLLDLASGLE
jgi:triosephosphate isomerase